jgi:hypothetical protein
MTARAKLFLAVAVLVAVPLAAWAADSLRSAPSCDPGDPCCQEPCCPGPCCAAP